MNVKSVKRAALMERLIPILKYVILTLEIGRAHV